VFRDESSQLSRLSLGLLVHVFELLLDCEVSEDSPVVTTKSANGKTSVFPDQPQDREE
jgi:hypothetical protein